MTNDWVERCPRSIEGGAMWRDQWRGWRFPAGAYAALMKKLRGLQRRRTLQLDVKALPDVADAMLTVHRPGNTSLKLFILFTCKYLIRDAGKTVLN